MNPDQLEEKLTKGITKAVSLISAAVFFFILYSASAATDVFYRRRFGQRFFTPWRAFFGCAGWSAAIYVGAWQKYNADYNSPLVPDWLKLATNLIFIAYLIFAIIRLREIRARFNAGEIWHSRSRGESVFGVESFPRDIVIDLVATLALFLILPTLAEFYILSRALGYSADSIAANQFYNRILDIRDAQIDAEHMEAALRATAEVRRHRKGAEEPNIVRVIVASQPGGPLAVGPTFSHDQNNEVLRQRGLFRRMIWWLRTMYVASRRFFVLSLLFIVVTIMPLSYRLSKQGYDYVAAKWHQMRSTKSPTLDHSADSDADSTFDTSGPPIDKATVERELAERKKQEGFTQKELEKRQSLEQERTKREQDEREEQQKRRDREEKERLAARQSAIDSLAQETAQQKQAFQDFKAASVAKYQDNTNRIDKVLPWFQNGLTATNDSLWVRLVVLVGHQNEVFDHADQIIAQLKQDSSAPVDQHKAGFAEAWAEMENERKSFQKDLDDLNMKIKKTRQHLFKKND